MLEQTLTTVSETATAALQAFLLPGELLLTLIDRIAPQTAAIMTFGNGGTIILFMLALLSWTLVLIAGLLVSKLCRNIAWQISAVVRTLVYRFRSWLGHLKTRLLWKYRKLFPYRNKQDVHVSPTEFDEIDIAVLRSVSDKGPGFVLSAPELAEKFTLRPAQVQSRLEKLRKNNMLRPTKGTTDGFENYGLTDSGQAFVAMFQRQQAAG